VLGRRTIGPHQGPDQALLKLAYAYEQATNHRHVPKFLPTADLTA